MNRTVEYLTLLCALGAALLPKTETTKDLSELVKTLHLALNKHDRNGGKYHRDDDQRLDNNNHDLVNTIVNHNNKLKTIENKFNVMVNNLVNASQLQDLVEKQPIRLIIFVG